MESLFIVIALSFLPSEQMANMETEEQLTEIPIAFETEDQLKEKVWKKSSGVLAKLHIATRNFEEDLQITMFSHQALAENAS